MSPEERAKAVIAYFPGIPERIRLEVQAIVARAIRRAIAQELANLERAADQESLHAEGRGKQARGRDPSAIHFHRVWQKRLAGARATILAGIPGAHARTVVRDRIRPRVLKPGDVVTVHPCGGAYTELPPGLDHGSRVTVVTVDRGNALVEAGGQEYTVAFSQIEMPCDIWWRGQWIDRFTHPEGEQAYREVVGFAP